MRLAFIIAAFNAQGTLRRALDSVLRQRHQDWEALVVDDGSTDSTLAIAQEYAARDPRFRVIHQANAGSGAARNAAIAIANADYTAYLDADDNLADDYTTVMLELMAEYPDRDIYSSDGLFVHDDGSTSLVFDYGKVVSVRIENLLYECWILGGGALIRTEALRSLGGFREHLYGEDYDLWLRALAAGYSHVASPEPVYVYHKCVGGQKSEDPRAGVESMLQALQDLADSGSLTPRQETQARARIAAVAAGLESSVTGTWLGALRRLVARLFGDGTADSIKRRILTLAQRFNPNPGLRAPRLRRPKQQ